MDTHQGDPEQLSAEVNRLYWESETSVNQIGEELGLSKGALYGLLEPLPAGLPCISCGEEMSYPNRTARDKGFVTCDSCGYEEVEEVVQEHWEDAAVLEAAGETVTKPTSLTTPGEEEALREEMATHEQAVVSGRQYSGRIVAGSALIGVALGIMIGAHLRKE